ncbi:MAG: flagellar motor switch protein FliN [Phycisphaerales bacterium]|nr:flagellar motor switch protein FliN [Phycisphaerales bacterium]
MAQAALKAAQDAIASLQSDVNQAASAPGQPGPADAAAEGGAPFELPVFSGVGEAVPPKGIDLLSDVNLNVKIELGRTRMLVEDVLKLAEGAIVELEKLAGDPVDIFVNDRPIARGEVLVLNDNFCVRINEILQPGADERAIG